MQTFLTFLAVMTGMALVDWIWTIWASMAAKGRGIPAGLASASIVLVNSFVVREYVHEPALIAAAAIGAFIGTALPLLLKRRMTADQP